MAAFEKSKLKSDIEIFYLQNSSNKTNGKLFCNLKQHVYAGNWSAKNREGLICRIEKCVREIDMNMIIKMFDNLPPKIIKAKNHGLDSLL